MVLCLFGDERGGEEAAVSWQVDAEKVRDRPWESLS